MAKLTRLLIYFNLSNEELIRRIASEDIIAKKIKKSGKLKFRVFVAWQFDDCPLADNGGQCLYFEAYKGKKISFLMELDEQLKAQHPN